MTDRYNAHQELIKRTNLILHAKYPWLKIQDRHVGKFILIRFIQMVLKNKARLQDWKKNLISVNRKGMADQYILMPAKIGTFKFQIHIEVEYKTGEARQTPEQLQWQKEIESSNGHYVLVRKPNDLVFFVDGLLTEILSFRK